jgi:hypothetical protein
LESDEDDPYPLAVVAAPRTAEAERHAKATVNRSLEAEQYVHFNQARDKLEKWADDMVLVG